MNLRDKLFWIKCTNSIPSWVSIDTLDRYYRSTSWSVLDWHSINNSVDTGSTLHRQFGQLIFDWCTGVVWHSANYELTVDQLLLIECWPPINGDVDRVQIEILSEGVNWRSWPNTQLPVPLLHMIPCFIALMSSHIFSMMNYTGLEKTEGAYTCTLTRSS